MLNIITESFLYCLMFDAVVPSQFIFTIYLTLILEKLRIAELRVIKAFFFLEGDIYLHALLSEEFKHSLFEPYNN